MSREEKGIIIQECIELLKALDFERVIAEIKAKKAAIL